MNIHLIEQAVDALGELVGNVVFVGGTTVELWISDEGADPVRATIDVDVVIEIAERGQLHTFEAGLRTAGFRNDVEGGVICRWLHGPAAQHLVLDVMPTNDQFFGFANRWMPAAFVNAVNRVLPTGRSIRVIPPAYLLASKLEAFNGRGGRDHFGSRDLEDVITLINGRTELVTEVGSASPELRAFVATEAARLLEDPSFTNALPGLIRPEDRVDAVIVPRLLELSRLAD